MIDIHQQSIQLLVLKYIGTFLGERDIRSLNSVRSRPINISLDERAFAQNAPHKKLERQIFADRC